MSYQFPSTGQYITFPHVSAADGATKCLISYWIRNADRDDGVHVKQYDDGTSKGVWVGMGSGPTSVLVKMHDTSGGWRSNTNTIDSATTASTWQHICVLWDRAVSGTAVKFYRDGTLLATMTSPGDMLSSAIGTTTALLQVGGVTSSAFADVYLGEVACWFGTADTSYPALLAAYANPMAMAVQPSFYAPLKDNAVALVGGTGTLVSSPTLQSGVHPPIEAPPAGDQLAYPASDIAAGSWTSTGANLFSVLEDDSDATYIRSSSGSGSDVATVALDAISLPQAGTVTLRVRHKAV